MRIQTFAIAVVAWFSAAFAAVAVEPVAAAAASCPGARTRTVQATVPYSDTRGCITSFDGTAIVYNLYEPLHPAPHSLYTIMESPGFANPGGTADVLLLKAGFADMTWDPRGFGQSGGYAEIDAPWAEGRDVSELITKVLTGRPEIAVDTGGRDGQPRYDNDSSSSNTDGEPVVGMNGVSYGGGVQLAAAAYDPRIKALVPGFTWNDLSYALFPGDVVKNVWDLALTAAGEEGGTTQHLGGDLGGFPGLGGTGGLQLAGGIDPSFLAQVLPAFAAGYASAAQVAYVSSRSVAAFGATGHVPRVPTLLVQGLADTLFNANDATANYAELKAADPSNPVKILFQCLGHTDCQDSTAAGQVAPASSPVWPGLSSEQAYDNAIVAWLEHYLRGVGTTDGMPDAVVYQDQTGAFHGLSSMPVPADPGPADYVSAPLAAHLTIDAIPTGGLDLGVSSGSGGDTAAFIDAATDPHDPGQATVPVLTAPAARPLAIAGVGHVTADITQTSAATNLYFRLLDKETGDVVDLQTEPLRVPAGTDRISLDLAGIGYQLAAGDTLELQVSTSTTLFAPNRTAGSVTLSDGTVELPVIAASRSTASMRHRGHRRRRHRRHGRHRSRRGRR